MENKIVVSKENTIQNGAVVYCITGFFQGTSMSFEDVLDELQGNYNPPHNPDNGQHYVLERGVLKISTNKKGETVLRINKRTELDEQVGKDAWQALPNGTRDSYLYGDQGFTVDSFNENWFDNYTDAKNKFDDNVKNGFQFK